MPRVRFVKDYVYTPGELRQVSTKFRAGKAIVRVNRECAELAVAAGAAEVVDATLAGDRRPELVGKPRARRAHKS
jgi:hypothetical protein